MHKNQNSASSLSTDKRFYIQQSLGGGELAMESPLRIDDFVNPATTKIVDIFHCYESPQYKIHMAGGRTTKCCATGTCDMDTGAVFCHFGDSWSGCSN